MLGLPLFPGVVLFVVNLPRNLVLLLIHGSFVSLSQLATVGLAHSAHFLVDALFLIFQMRGFPRFQLAALDALRDAVLLILASLPNLVVTVVCRIGIVFVRGDLVRKVILLIVQLGCDPPWSGGHHRPCACCSLPCSVRLLWFPGFSSRRRSIVRSARHCQSGPAGFPCGP